MSISANSPDTPIGLGGYEDPTWIIKNVDEIVAVYRELDRPELCCAYGGEIFRSMKIDAAIAWFRYHACSGEGEPIP